MDCPITANDIAYAENCVAQADPAAACEMLERMRDDAERYIDAACEATDKKQHFSFDNTFERLAYRRVENDPRELEQAPASFSRMYAALAYGYIRLGKYEKACDAMKQAVRWNPMNCGYRLDLAELFGALGNTQESAALSASVLGRASDARSLGCAYANLGQFFLTNEQPLAASACARLAATYAPDEPRVAQLNERLTKEAPQAADEPDKKAFAALEAEGIAASPSAEIAICLVMCAADEAKAGNVNEATRLTLAARDLVGQKACEAIVKLVQESDAELEQERKKGGK